MTRPGCGQLGRCFVSFALMASMIRPGAASASLPLTTGAVPQGLYESCGPQWGMKACNRRLRTIGAAGFRVVINYSQLEGTAQEELDYARHAADAHVQIIWNFSYSVFWQGGNALTQFPLLARTCKCSNNTGFVQYVVRLVKNLPATWGYYVGDEVPAQYGPGVAALSSAIRAVDRGHPLLFVAIGGMNVHAIRGRLEPFVNSADVLGADHYPVGVNEPIHSEAAIARSLQKYATRQSRQTALVLQSFSWAQYPWQQYDCSPFPACATFPTVKQMQELRLLAESYATPSLILWYSYFNILGWSEPEQTWDDVVQAAFGPSSLSLRDFDPANTGAAWHR